MASQLSRQCLRYLLKYGCTGLARNHMTYTRLRTYKVTFGQRFFCDVASREQTEAVASSSSQTETKDGDRQDGQLLDAETDKFTLEEDQRNVSSPEAANLQKIPVMVNSEKQGIRSGVTRHDVDSDVEHHETSNSNVIEMNNSHMRPISTEDWKSESDSGLVLDEIQKLPKQKVEPAFHLSEYVNESETLSQLVRMGVDLAEVQKVNGASDLIIKLDFEKDVKPYLFFLHDLGISEDDLGKYLSKNPLIFKEDLDDLQVRINYLESKQYSQEAIARIVVKAQVFLLMPVKMVDAKLGYLQKQYKLSGNEVRFVTTRLPKLISWNTQKLKDTRFYMKEFLGFSDAELKQIMITCPKVYLTNKYSMGKKFDYLHNTMQITHARLVEWPNIFRARLHIIQQRHSFLQSVERAQYDPTLENFVPLKKLMSGTDKDFCTTVAKVSVQQYNNFLKSI